MDEPEQRLDTEGVGWLAARLKAERQQGLAIVFASHEPALVETVATRVVELGAPARMSTRGRRRSPGSQPASPRPRCGAEADAGLAHGPGHPNLLEAFNDAYVAVIGAVMIGAMLVNVVLKAQRTVAQCSTASCLSARTILPWAAFAAAVAVALAASRLFGPVLASAAEGFWLLDAPISRAKLLGARLVAAVVRLLSAARRSAH